VRAVFLTRERGWITVIIDVDSPEEEEDLDLQ
jgi:hypothetical protein